MKSLSSSKISHLSSNDSSMMNVAHLETPSWLSYVQMNYTDNPSKPQWINQMINGLSQKEKNMRFFLDMNIFIKISLWLFRLFKTLQHLLTYLYIPLLSCRPKEVSNSLVFGHFIRIYILCCESKTILKESIGFTNHLPARGYTFEDLSSLLDSANWNVIKYVKHFSLSIQPSTTRPNKTAPASSSALLFIPVIQTKKSNRVGNL